MGRIERRDRTVIILALVGVAGLLALLAAHRFHMPGLIGPGLLLFGAGVVTAGVSTILLRYSSARESESGETAIFEGTAAGLLGLTVVVAGIAFGAAGMAYTLGFEHDLYAHLLRRPGLPMLGAGVAVGGSGMAAVIGAREWRGSIGRVLLHLPQRIGGLFLLLFGLALAATGAWETAAPDAFDTTLESLLAAFRTPTR